MQPASQRFAAEIIDAARRNQVLDSLAFDYDPEIVREFEVLGTEVAVLNDADLTRRGYGSYRYGYGYGYYGAKSKKSERSDTRKRG